MNSIPTFYIIFFLLYADKGEVFGWGNSEYNQFSMVTDEQQINLPVKLDLGPIGKVIDIASGGSICMVLNGKFMKNIRNFNYFFQILWKSRCHISWMVTFPSHLF